MSYKITIKSSHWITPDIQNNMFDMFHSLVVSSNGYMTRWSIVRHRIKFTVSVPVRKGDDFMYRYVGFKLETALNRLKGAGYIVERDIKAN